MHRSRLGQLVIDCGGIDLDQAASFWAAVLGHHCSRLKDPQDAKYRQLLTDEGQLPILLQSVNHHSRIHLDLESTDVEAEVRRLEVLGARRIEQVRTWWVMEAPSGHRFCVLGQQRADLPDHGHLWGA